MSTKYLTKRGWRTAYAAIVIYEFWPVPMTNQCSRMQKTSQKWPKFSFHLRWTHFMCHSYSFEFVYCTLLTTQMIWSILFTERTHRPIWYLVRHPKYSRFSFVKHYWRYSHFERKKNNTSTLSILCLVITNTRVGVTTNISINGMLYSLCFG